ncbi:MAG: PqiC family protein [Candidatus Methylomirabilales bacterium]
MMRRLCLRVAAVTLGASVMILGGCIGGKSSPAKFFVLSALPNPETTKGAVAAERGVAIGVGPVSLPPYLDRPEIVTRAGGNKLHLAEFDRWAEPLRQNFTRVLAQNLSNLIPTDRAALYPWERSVPIKYQVLVDVARFEGSADGNSLLMARWSIVGADGKQELLAGQSSFSESIGPPQDYEATVSAMSRTLADLSREIAAAIKTLSQQTPQR